MTEGKKEAGFIVFPKPVSHSTICCQITVNSILPSAFIPLLFFAAEYLEQVDLEEEKNAQEARAVQEIESGDADAHMLPRLLERLSGPGRVPSYYHGGLELLTLALAGSEWPLAEEKCPSPSTPTHRHFFFVLPPVIFLRSFHHLTGSPISQLCD